MFQLKDFPSIAASMFNYARATQDKLTDFNVGSVTRTLLESPAIEIEELYQRIFAGIMEAIPVAIYRGFNFAILDASSARGFVRVRFAIPLEHAISVPEGTVFASSATGTSYISDQAVTVPVGASETLIPVTCSETGSRGNVPADAINSAKNYNFPSGSQVGNEPISSGRDQESDEERKARFADFVRSLSRGTLESVLFAASIAQVKSETGITLEFVARISSREEAGHVDVYLYGSNGVASDDLITAAQQLIDGYYETDGTHVPGYRPAGVRVAVQKMHERLVAVTLNVPMMPGVSLTDSLIAQIKTLLVAEFGRVESGGTLYMRRLTDAALAVDGIQESFSSNNANVLCATNEALRLGQLTVSVIDA